MSSEDYPHQRALEGEGSNDQGDQTNPWDLTAVAEKFIQDKQNQKLQNLEIQQFQYELNEIKQQLMGECQAEIQRVKLAHDHQLNRLTMRYEEHIELLQRSLQQHTTDLENVKNEAGTLGRQHAFEI